MNTTDLKSFHYLENGEISFSMFDTIKSTKTLEKGSYKISCSGYPEYRISLSLNKDEETIKIHSFPDKEKLDCLFDSFFNERVIEKMKILGFYHKFGILLYGKEGTGKSTILKYYYNKLIEKRNAIVFYITNKNEYVRNCWEFVMNVRRIQKNPIVIIFEEFDEQLQNEGYIKTILDGNNAIDNCIFMATTNYIDKIPEAMKNRPSRFKYVLNIEGIQDVNEVFDILYNILNDLFIKEEILNFASELKGQTLDFIKQFCMDKIMELKTHNFFKPNKIGFK